LGIRGCNLYRFPNTQYPTPNTQSLIDLNRHPQRAVGVVGR
jgi:hypothetical protein